MSSYYVAHEGQQQGPFSISEIELKLKTEKLNWHDYVYDEKLRDWVLLMEFSLLTNLFNQSFQNPIGELTSETSTAKSSKESDPLRKRIWYVLKQNNNYGPFSKSELIQMLQGKTLHEYDFIWNNDMPAWKRLADVEEFSMEQMLELYTQMQSATDASGNTLFYRRKHPRVKLTTQAMVHDQKKVYKSVSVEISAGGAGLIIEDADFKKDQQIYLHLKPAEGLPAFNAICKIVSHRGTKYGVQFVKISASAKNAISLLTELNQNKKAA